MAALVAPAIDKLGVTPRESLLPAGSWPLRVTPYSHATGEFHDKAVAVQGGRARNA